MKLNVKAFGAVLGVFTGFSVFFITWWIILFEGASSDPTFLGIFYRGYEVTAIGSLIGLAYGLADGFFGGLIFAWLYNYFTDRFKK